MEERFEVTIDYAKIVIETAVLLNQLLIKTELDDDTSKLIVEPLIIRLFIDYVNLFDLEKNSYYSIKSKGYENIDKYIDQKLDKLNIKIETYALRKAAIALRGGFFAHAGKIEKVSAKLNNFCSTHKLETMIWDACAIYQVCAERMKFAPVNEVMKAAHIKSDSIVSAFTA